MIAMAVPTFVVLVGIAFNFWTSSRVETRIDRVETKVDRIESDLKQFYLMFGELRGKVEERKG